MIRKKFLESEPKALFFCDKKIFQVFFPYECNECQMELTLGEVIVNEKLEGTYEYLTSL